MGNFTEKIKILWLAVIAVLDGIIKNVLMPLLMTSGNVLSVE